MDILTYSGLVAERLHPHPYVDCVVDLPDEISLLLTCKKFLFARYALAVCLWEPSMSGPNF